MEEFHGQGSWQTKKNGKNANNSIRWNGSDSKDSFQDRPCAGGMITRERQRILCEWIKNGRRVDSNALINYRNETNETEGSLIGWGGSFYFHWSRACLNWLASLVELIDGITCKILADPAPSWPILFILFYYILFYFCFTSSVASFLLLWQRRF